MKSVTNLTSKKQVLAGVEIAPSSQETVREELITQDELSLISEDGNIVTFGRNEITVKKALKEVVKVEIAPTEEVKVYPSNLITEKGNLTGRQDALEEIEKLQAEHGENILTDSEFEKLYPSSEVEEFRLGV